MLLPELLVKHAFGIVRYHLYMILEKHGPCQDACEAVQTSLDIRA